MVVFDNVDFPTNLFGFARFQTADSKVTMDARDYTLKYFLVGIPGNGEYLFVVG